eukprot:10522886-Lingulodinium_polyedra.AAC.1
MDRFLKEAWEPMCGVLSNGAQKLKRKRSDVDSMSRGIAMFDMSEVKNVWAGETNMYKCHGPITMHDVLK